jgi:DNA-binding NarL/FixJ family response regulator
MTYAVNIALLCRDHRRAEEWRRQLEVDGRFQVVAIGQWASESGALIKHADPDVLVSELQLSDGPAAEVVRQQRKGPSGMGLMILLVASAADDPALLECLRLGADSYYIDQGPGPTLSARVLEMLNGEAKMSPAIARQVLDHFSAQRPKPGMASRPVDEILNPLLLSHHERSVLLRLAQGQSVPQIASAERMTMHEVAKCIRGLYRKMTWDLRTDGLKLELI